MRRRATLILLLSIASFAGCSEGWKRADAAAGGALAPHVDTTKVDGRTVMRIRSRGAVVLIDQEGGRVIDYRLQRRPRWVFVRDEKDEDRMAMKAAASPAMPGVIAPPGWHTPVDPPNEGLARNVYWHVDSSANRVVLLSETVAGLRFRKTYELDERSNALDLTVELENRTFDAVTVSAASVLPSVGERVSEGDREWASSDGQTFTRELVEPPAGASAEGFRFAPLRIEPFKRVRWRERWWIERSPATTQPSEPGGPQPATAPGAGR